MNQESLMRMLFGGLNPQANTGTTPVVNSTNTPFANAGILPIGLQLLQGGMNIYSGFVAQRMAMEQNKFNLQAARTNVAANLAATIERAEITESQRKAAMGKGYRPRRKFIEQLTKLQQRFN